MRTHARLVLGAAALSGTVLLGAPAASAQEACSAYAETCDEGVLPTTFTPLEVAPQSASTGVSSLPSSQPSTLPFTGGETTLVALAGAGALAAGGVLIAVGRRRRVVEA